MKIRSILLLLIATSCTREFGLGCNYPTQDKIIEAQRHMGTINTSLAKNISERRAQEMFGCLYRKGDEIYVYKSFLWGKERYILVRNKTAITIK